MNRGLNKVRQVIEHSGLKKKEIAKILYPSNRYPEAAFIRLMQGKSELTVKQLEMLATYFDCDLKDFYDYEWKGKATKDHYVITRVTRDGVKLKAFLDMSTGKTRLFSNNDLLYETLIHSKAITLNDYIRIINRLLNL